MNWHDVNKSLPPIATGYKALSEKVKVKTKHGPGTGYYNHINNDWLVELYSDKTDELQSYTGVTYWKYIMIPARIISLDPVTVEWYNLPKPNTSNLLNPTRMMYYFEAKKEYMASRTIAEVENVRIYADRINESYFGRIKLTLNQSCFIKPTEKGKCKIVKLN